MIKAARLYPLVSFDYPGSEKKPLNYIRVDYRLEISIEPFLDADLAPSKLGTDSEDQAGVFKDQDFLRPIPTIQNIYSAVEKPVQCELLGEGLSWGNASQWDNIHQWPREARLPLTPGAPHACHLHWRWGASYGVEGDLRLPRGGPQFAGPSGSGTPLLDPRIPIQRLRFAITTDSEKDWQANSSENSTSNFEDLFLKKRVPSNIQRGANLTVWISVEAVRLLSPRPWQGVFFVHGLFFAHDTSVPWATRLSAANMVFDYRKPAMINTTDDQAWWRPKSPEKRVPISRK